MIPFVLALLLAAAQDPADEFAVRAAALGDGNGSARAWLDLSDVAEARLLFREREVALRKVLELDPGNAIAHERLDEVLLGKEWLTVDEADKREIAQNEAKGRVFYGTGWMPPAEAEVLRKADCRRLGWDVVLRIELPHVVLYSGRGLAESRRIASVLEHAYEAYRRLYGGIWKLEPLAAPCTAFLFPDRASFVRTAKARYGPDLALPESSAGFYGPDSGILYLSEIRGDMAADLIATAVHEFMHGLDSRMATFARAMPLWLQEGRAEHLAHGILGRQVLPGHLLLSPAESYPGLLEAGLDGFDLEAFLALDDDRFMEGDARGRYAFSWALVHFLFHAEASRGQAFRAYLAGFQDPSAPARFRADKALKTEFKEWCRRTFLPAITKAQADARGKPCP